MEHTADIKLAIIIRLCGISFRQDSCLLPWCFYTIAETMRLNPIWFTEEFFVCDVPSFIQEHFYFEVIDDVALRATCDVSKSEGSRIFIRDSIRLGKTFIRLHRLLDLDTSYHAVISNTVMLCEVIYSEYFKIGLDTYELNVLRQLTNKPLQKFHIYDPR